MSAFIHKNRVEFSDTDMAGIVHFARFFCYAEAAEAALFRSIEEPLIDMDNASGWPRISATFDYNEPLSFDEEFETHLSIERLGTTSIAWLVEVKAGSDVIATGKMTSIYCTASTEGMAKQEIPAALKAKLESFIST